MVDHRCQHIFRCQVNGGVGRAGIAAYQVLQQRVPKGSQPIGDSGPGKEQILEATVTAEGGSKAWGQSKVESLHKKQVPSLSHTDS